MRSNRNGGFTVVELLVVVAIIALLVGILLPAIGKARDGAMLSTSQSNARQIAIACQSYATEHGDRQMTFINDQWSQYANGSTSPNYTICQVYAAANGNPHPPIVIGYVPWPVGSNTMAPYQISFDPAAGAGVMNAAFIYSQPINLMGTYAKLGSFRLLNCRPLATFLNGRFYDKTFYAPKDRGVVAAAEPYFDYPHEAVYEFDAAGNSLLYWSSYCLSPAAMYNPAVFSEQMGNTSSSSPMYNNPWTTPAGFKSPAMSQARFGNLKTLVIEHSWLQNNRRGHCNPVWNAATATYAGCEPWYFNASLQSAPVSAFYDGHVDSVGVRDAMDSNQRVLAQHGQTTSSGTKGTWSRSTPLGGVYEAPVGTAPNVGYWQNAWAADGAATAFHILTTYGIKGRDIVPR